MANEKRLIDANDAEQFAREHILDAKERYTILDFLRECATVDAVPVVHGRWIDGFFKNTVECSVCFDNGICKCYETKHNYCPRCGAKMDGGNEDG